MSQPDPTLQPHEAGGSKYSHDTEQGPQHRDSNTWKNPLTAELWADSLLLREGSRERDNIFAVLVLEVIHCLQKGLSCVHTLWSKLMFVYRDCKAGEQECFTVLLVVSSIKGSLRRPFGVQGEKSPVTATSGDAYFQEKSDSFCRVWVIIWMYILLSVLSQKEENKPWRVL